MEMMSKERWAGMTDEQRCAHLQAHDIEYRSKRFLNGNKKVGDHSAVGTFYQAMIGGVIMSLWHKDKQECAKEAVDNLAAVLARYKQAGGQ